MSDYGPLDDVPDEAWDRVLDDARERMSSRQLHAERLIADIADDIDDLPEPHSERWYGASHVINGIRYNHTTSYTYWVSEAISLSGRINMLLHDQPLTSRQVKVLRDLKQEVLDAALAMYRAPQ